MPLPFKNKIPLFLFLLFGLTVTAQDEKTPVPHYNADSLASGNYKDVLNSFFQLAFENFTGNQKEFKFTSNPFAIMLKANPNLAVDTSYIRYRHLRNLNFTVSAKLDDNYKFNGFSSGITYAVINRRDQTVYREFNNLVRFKNREYEQLTNGIADAMSVLPAGSDLRNRLRDQGRKLLRDSSFLISQLDADVRKEIEKIINENKLEAIGQYFKSKEDICLYRRKRDGYEDVKKQFQNRLLWTVSVSDTTYTDKFMFSNIGFNTKVLKGISNPDKASNIELELNAGLNLLDDTLRSGRDLKRSLLTSEAGFNWVVKSKHNRQSLFELKFSAAYNRIFNGIYAGEEKELFTLNGTFRVRVYDDIWVPVQFRYDPETGNVFGWLSVKFNFTGLKSLIKGK